LTRSTRFMKASPRAGRFALERPHGHVSPGQRVGATGSAGCAAGEFGQRPGARKERGRPAAALDALSFVRRCALVSARPPFRRRCRSGRHVLRVEGRPFPTGRRRLVVIEKNQQHRNASGMLKIAGEV